MKKWKYLLNVAYWWTVPFHSQWVFSIKPKILNFQNRGKWYVKCPVVCPEKIQNVVDFPKCKSFTILRGKSNGTEMPSKTFCANLDISSWGCPLSFWDLDNVVPFSIDLKLIFTKNWKQNFWSNGKHSAWHLYVTLHSLCAGICHSYHNLLDFFF